MLTDRRHSSSRPHLLALLAMTVLFFARFLFTGRILLLRDLFILESPTYLFYRESLLSGGLPLWDPYTGCGEPVLADMAVGVFYPFNLVFLALPLRYATTLFAAFHVFLAGAATFALCRAWRVSRMGSLLAAVAFAFSSWTITRVEFFQALASVAWVPASLAVFTHWLDRPRRTTVLLLALVLCLGLLAGWPEASFFTAGSLALYATIAGAARWRTGRRPAALVQPLATVAIAGLLAVGLAAVQIAPTWEAVGRSMRAEGIDPELRKGTVDPFMLAALLVPSVYGVPGHEGRYWAPSCDEYRSGTFYIGLAPLVILCMALMGRALSGRILPGGRRRRLDLAARAGASAIRTPLLAALAVLSLLYAMGDYTPLFPLLWKLLPILHKFRTPSKSLICFVLAMSCLSGIAWDDLRRLPRRIARPAKGRWRAIRITPWAIAAALGLGAFACLVHRGLYGRKILTTYFNLGSVPPFFRPWIPWSSIVWDVCKLPAAAAAIAAVLSPYIASVRRRRILGRALVLILFCDLLGTNSSLLVDGRPETLERPSRYLAALRPPGPPVRFSAACGGHDLYGQQDERAFRVERDVLRGKWPLADRAFHLESEAAFAPWDTGQVLDLLSQPNVPQESKARLYAMLNCDRIVRPYAIRHLLAGQFGTVEIASLGPALPRAYVAGGLRMLPHRTALLQELAFGRFDPAATALAVSGCAADPRAAALQPGRVPYRLQRIVYGRNRLDVKIESARDGVLVVSDSFYPGWQARVNGRDTAIFEVNGGFRGLYLPAGLNRIEMVYRPASLRLGAAVSLFTAALIAVLLAAHWRRRRRKERAKGGARTSSGQAPSGQASSK